MTMLFWFYQSRRNSKYASSHWVSWSKYINQW